MKRLAAKAMADLSFTMLMVSDRRGARARARRGGAVRRALVSGHQARAGDWRAHGARRRGEDRSPDVRLAGRPRRPGRHRRGDAGGRWRSPRTSRRCCSTSSRVAGKTSRRCAPPARSPRMAGRDAGGPRRAAGQLRHRRGAPRAWMIRRVAHHLRSLRKLAAPPIVARTVGKPSSRVQRQPKRAPVPRQSIVWRQFRNQVVESCHASDH
jgi:hypothetical protein